MMAIGPRDFFLRHLRKLFSQFSDSPAIIRIAQPTGVMMPIRPRRSDPPVFHVVLIKPTHYDDDGYPIRWVKAAIPSNTLASLNSLAEDAVRRQVLGPDVASDFIPSTRPINACIRLELIRAIRKTGGRALIGLVGVQSNQFPRAVDLARPFRIAGSAGLHRWLSRLGLIAMLPADDTRDGRGASARHFVLCRRGRRRAYRRGLAGRMEWRAAARLQLHERPAGTSKPSRCRYCRGVISAGSLTRFRASISVAAAPINARFARSSTSRAARAGFARQTISNGPSGKITRAASADFSLRTTISRATATGRRCSTG